MTLDCSHVRVLFFGWQASQSDICLDFPFMPNVVVFSAGGCGNVHRDDCTDGSAGFARRLGRLDSHLDHTADSSTQSSQRSYADQKRHKNIAIAASTENHDMVSSPILPPRCFLHHVRCASEWQFVNRSKSACLTSPRQYIWDWCLSTCGMRLWRILVRASFLEILGETKKWDWYLSTCMTVLWGNLV